MNRVPVASSNLSEVGYDPAANVLEIAFKQSGVYQYFAVPRSIYEGLLAAPSAGRYFDLNVKKAGYAMRKVSA